MVLQTSQDRSSLLALEGTLMTLKCSLSRYPGPIQVSLVASGLRVALSQGHPCSTLRFVLYFSSCMAVGRFCFVWSVIYFLAAVGGSPKAAFRNSCVVICLIAACGGQPKAASQDIQVCSLLSCCIWRAAEGGLSVYRGFEFYFVCCVWWAAKSRLSTYPVCSLLPCRTWRAAGGRLSGYPGLLCMSVSVHAGRPKAAS